jgi:hypothetical protein
MIFPQRERAFNACLTQTYESSIRKRRITYVTLRPHVQATIDVMSNNPQYDRPAAVNCVAEAHGADGPRCNQVGVLRG